MWACSSCGRVHHVGVFIMWEYVCFYLGGLKGVSKAPEIVAVRAVATQTGGRNVVLVDGARTPFVVSGTE